MTSGSPTGSRRRLGIALRRLREEAGITGESAAAAVDRSASWISRIESGRTGLRSRELRDLLDLYHLTDDAQRAELEGHAEQGRRRAWWSQHADRLSPPFIRYIGLEAESRTIEIFQNVVVPGLLQTADYARAIHELAVPRLPDEEIRQNVAVRQRRQGLLTEPDGPRLTAIVEEAVLRRVYGTVEILRGQLDHLLREADRESVEIRVIALSETARTLPAHGFTILHFDDDPPVSYVDTVTGGFVEEGPSVPAAYGAVWRHLIGASLDPEESRASIRRAIDQLR